MKYYVNTQTRLLGNDRTTYWMDTLFPIFDPNIINRYDYLVSELPENTETVEINQETGTVLLIELDGQNIVEQVSDNVVYSSLVELMDEMVEKHNAAIEQAKAQ